MTDERDRAIERLMRRARTEPRTADACPDAEMLAAWSEGGLRQPERESLELHVSDCARCQAILATMVEPALAPAVAPVSLWRRWHLEWVVPITAAAAAAIVWMVVPSDAPVPVTESARIEPQAEPSATDLRIGGRAATEPAEQQAGQTVALEATPAPARNDLRDQLQPLRREQAFEAKPAAEPAPAVAEARGAAAVAATGAVLAEPTAAQPAAVEQARERTAAAPPAPAAVAAPMPAAAPPSPAADAAFRADQTPPAGRGGRGGAPGGGGAGTGRGSGFGAGTGAGAGAAPVSAAVYGVVISPEPAIRWRFSNLGTVDLSTNVGATWDRLQFGVIGALIAGSSPAPTICWIVGRGGVVIVTADIRTWRRVTFPEATDLTAVEAVDAQIATVTAADGRRWQTRDGGATWSSLQDF